VSFAVRKNTIASRRQKLLPRANQRQAGQLAGQVMGPARLGDERWNTVEGKFNLADFRRGPQ